MPIPYLGTYPGSGDLSNVGFVQNNVYPFTGKMANGGVAETIPRWSAASNLAVLTSGTLFVAQISLRALQVVTNITWVSGTQALVTGTNQWVVLMTSTRSVLAVSANGTSGAWAANSAKTFALGTPYTSLFSTDYYVGLMVSATTVPSLLGFANTFSAVTNLTPPVHATSSTGQTTPPSVSATMAAFASVAVGTPYAYCT